MKTIQSYEKKSKGREMKGGSSEKQVDVDMVGQINVSLCPHL